MVPGLQERAQRFSLLVPVYYRRPGQDVWAGGVSVNMSRSGLLFMTDQPLLETGALLDVRVDLSTTGCGSRCEIGCRGHVVRRVLPAVREAGALAIAIHRYALRRASRLPILSAAFPAIALQPPETMTGGRKEEVPPAHGPPSPPPASGQATARGASGLSPPRGPQSRKRDGTSRKSRCKE
jgi:hypothetical protein